MTLNESIDYNAYVLLEECMQQYNMALGNSSGAGGGKPHIGTEAAGSSDEAGSFMEGGDDT